MGIVKDSGYLVASNVTLLATSLVSGIMASRLLGPEGRGELYLYIQFATLAGVILSCGLGASYQYHLSKKIFIREVIVSHMLI